MTMDVLTTNVVLFQRPRLRPLHISAMEVCLDNSTADECAEDMQEPPQAMPADVATAADRRFAMLEAPPINTPVLWHQTNPEPAEQWAMQGVAAGEAPTDSSVELTDSSSQTGSTNHAEPDGAGATAEGRAALSGAATDSTALTEVAWPGIDSWAAAAASLGGVPFAVPAAVAGAPLAVPQQSMTAARLSTAEGAADASADNSRSSSSIQVANMAEAAVPGVSADSSQSSNSAEHESVAGDSPADATAAAELSADSSPSNRSDKSQSKTEDVEAAAPAAADTPSDGGPPSSSSADRRTADSAQADVAPAGSSRMNSHGKQRRRTDSTELGAVVDAAGRYTNGSLLKSSREGQLSPSDSPESDFAAAPAMESANGARSYNSRWSTADGLEEPIDRREDVSRRYGVPNCALVSGMLRHFCWACSPSASDIMSG